MKGFRCMETLDLVFRIAIAHQPFYISICNSSLTQADGDIASNPVGNVLLKALSGYSRILILLVCFVNCNSLYID